MIGSPSSSKYTGTPFLNEYCNAEAILLASRASSGESESATSTKYESRASAEIRDRHSRLSSRQLVANSAKSLMNDFSYKTNASGLAGWQISLYPSLRGQVIHVVAVRTPY